MRIKVDGAQFSFPNDWIAEKYDEWAFYRKQFQNCAGGNKAVDITAIDQKNNTLWLIELKDYRSNRRTKSIDIADEVAIKARDTIAGLFAAARNASNREKTFAGKTLGCSKIRVALQLRQPLKNSKLFPRAINPASVKQKLRKIIKPIDAHPIINDRDTAMSVRWEVI